MGKARRAIGLGFVGVALVGVAGIACGRDFDDLFADADGGAGPSPSSSSPSSTGVSEAGGPSAEAGTDAAPDTSTGPGGCVPSPSQTCGNSQGCDGGTCSTVCSGCCKCDTQVCPLAEANKRCDGRCTTGATCSVDCSLHGPCELTCQDCTSSSFHCTASAGDCSTQCSPGSTCEQTCDSTSAGCTMTCPKGASCQLECAGSSCDLACEDGSLKDCGKNVFTCNKACPP